MADSRWSEPEPGWRHNVTQRRRDLENEGYWTTFIEMVALNNKFYIFGKIVGLPLSHIHSYSGPECVGAGVGAGARTGPRPHERAGAPGCLQVRHPRPPPAVRHGRGQLSHHQRSRSALASDHSDQSLHFIVFSGVLLIILSSAFILPSFLGYFGSSNYIRPCLVLVN